VEERRECENLELMIFMLFVVLDFRRDSITVHGLFKTQEVSRFISCIISFIVYNMYKVYAYL
jgi:hypothetical protein